MSISIVESITDYQKFNLGYKPFDINSYCSSACTYTVSSHATRTDNGVFRGERLKINGEGKTELRSLKISNLPQLILASDAFLKDWGTDI